MRLLRSRFHGAAILLVAACTITAFAQTAATKLPADIQSGFAGSASVPSTEKSG